MLDTDTRRARAETSRALVAAEAKSICLYDAGSPCGQQIAITWHLNRLELGGQHLWSCPRFYRYLAEWLYRRLFDGTHKSEFLDKCLRCITFISYLPVALRYVAGIPHLCCDDFPQRAVIFHVPDGMKVTLFCRFKRPK